MPEPPQPVLPDNKEDEFEPYSFYANNCQFESSVWDLKFKFAQLAQQGTEWKFDPRCEVTIPWMQAKIILFFLQLNLFNYEEENGPIKVSNRILPVSPEVISNPPEGTLIAGKTFQEYYRTLYEQMFPK